MKRKSYKSDLNDREWAIVAPYLPKAKTNGRPAHISRRRLVDAIFYIARTGCGWEYLPRDFPHWKTVYHYFRLWRLSGVWEAIHDALRSLVRQKSGRSAQPSAAIIDSQSVKTSSVGGSDRGYDGAKNTKGRKRHILVDTQGLLIGATVHSAALADRDGGILLLEKTAPLFPTIQKLWTDSAYNGRFLSWSKKSLPNWNIEMVKHWWSGLRGVWLAPGQKPPTIPTGFHVLPRRWVVERTFAWLNHSRRLAKDYERLPATSETFLYVIMIRLMLRRLSHSNYSSNASFPS